MHGDKARTEAFKTGEILVAGGLVYAPLAAGIGYVADRLNRLQFLTIRQFLTLVFVTLVLLLLVLAL